MEDSVELKNRILDETIKIFNTKGFKCTMDDIARGCGISKKTIYTVYKDKEELFLAMVDYLFDGVKREQLKVMSDEELDVIEKIRRIMSAMPASYSDIDFSKLGELKEKFPTVYFAVKAKLESGWESTFYLMDTAREQKLIRADADKFIVKLMFEASMEHFFQSDALKENNISYGEALAKVVDVLIDGILNVKEA